MLAGRTDLGVFEGATADVDEVDIGGGQGGNLGKYFSLGNTHALEVGGVELDADAEVF